MRWIGPVVAVCSLTWGGAASATVAFLDETTFVSVDAESSGEAQSAYQFTDFLNGDSCCAFASADVDSGPEQFDFADASAGTNISLSTPAAGELDLYESADGGAPDDGYDFASGGQAEAIYDFSDSGPGVETLVFTDITSGSPTITSIERIPISAGVHSIVLSDSDFGVGGAYPDYASQSTRESLTFQISPVPEPTAWALILSGILGVGAALRLARRREPATA
jgi:hypothetical protein